MIKNLQMRCDSIGRGEILLDDIEMTEMSTASTISVRRGEITVITLHLVPGAESGVNLDGIVRVAGKEAKKIAELDPEEIDREALGRIGWGSERSLTSTILEIIMEKIQ